MKHELQGFLKKKKKKSPDDYLLPWVTMKLFSIIKLLRICVCIVRKIHCNVIYHAIMLSCDIINVIDASSYN